MEKLMNANKILSKASSPQYLIKLNEQLDLVGQIDVFRNCFSKTLLAKHKDNSIRTCFHVRIGDLVGIAIGRIYTEEERKICVQRSRKKGAAHFFSLSMDEQYFGSPQDSGVQWLLGVRRANSEDNRINCDYFVCPYEGKNFDTDRNKLLCFRALCDMKPGSILIAPCGFDEVETVKSSDPNYNAIESGNEAVEKTKEHMMDE